MAYISQPRASIAPPTAVKEGGSGTAKDLWYVGEVGSKLLMDEY